MGIGSFIAVRRGLKARRLIIQSEGKLRGLGRVWWCLSVGGFGLAIWGGGLLVGIVARIVQAFGG
jgi:hypothetical protein